MDSRRGFVEGPSVAFWRDWELPQFTGTESLPAMAVSLLEAARKEIASPQEAAYWSYHAARTAFFAVQGTAGLAASALAGASAAHPVTGTVPNSLAAVSQGLRLVSEAVTMYKQDLAHIRQGTYKLPWDMDLRHRQFHPTFILDRTARFISEAVGTLRRRRVGRPDEIWLNSELYPDYYLQTWHYQTDGWLSSESASVYETSTETLFLGRQDAMQRQTLLPLVEHFRGRDTAGARILDAACGTGRFLTFVRDNLPGCHVTALDLSPFYLQEARDNHAHWEALRGDSSGAAGGSARFVQAPAERIPVPDGTYDAVTCVYLFHELPPAARADVARELARVLRPGGVLVLTDSVQLGDRPRLDGGLGRFGDFNEPHYRSYIQQDLGQLFCGVADLVPWRKEVASSSKVLAFRKRGGAAEQPPPPPSSSSAAPPASSPAASEDAAAAAAAAHQQQPPPHHQQPRALPVASRW